jgi:hypothetical protein
MTRPTWAATAPIPALGGRVYARPLMSGTGATSHVVFTGSRMVELRGLVWTNNGTVPMGRGTASEAPFGGPFSDSNWFGPIGGATSDVLDSTGDRFICAVFKPTSTGTSAVLVANGVYAATEGYGLAMEAAPIARFYSWSAAARNASSANSSTVNKVSVACAWRTGTGINVKLNLGATVNTAAGALETIGTARGAKIGRYENAGFPFTGRIYEIVQGLGACPGASCEAYATAQMNAVKSAMPQTTW